MRKNWFIAIGLWAGLMLLGWSVWPSRIERTLEASAREVLRSHPSARFLKDVTVSFDGQEAVLRGKVHKAAMRGVAAQIVGEELRRASGISGRFNPVTAVRNQIAVEPLPAGWLVMVLDGDRITLHGLAGSEDERDSVSQGAAKLLSKPGVEFRATVKANDETASASENADLSVNALPAQLRALGDRAAVLTARIGEEWQAHEPDAEKALNELLASYGVAPEQWDEEILPLVKQAQQRRAAQRHAEEQAARLAKLPPPHVILAIRGGDALVQGEVGTAALKSQIIEAALRACTGMQVFDQLRVSADRRPVVDAAAMLGFFPPAASAAKAGLIAVAVPGGEWKTVTLPANDVAAAILATLPRDMAASLVEADAKNVARWFADTSPDPSAPIKPCVTLAVFSDRVWLRGQVAEESSRSQIIEAARNAYPDHVLVHFIRLNPRCLPVEEALPTARSFPPAPGKDSSGIIGFAIPGEAWKSAPVSDSVFTPDGIQKAGILPQGFPLLNAMDEFSEALEALKIHWDDRKKTNSR
jgi:hypothetical protein